MASQSMVLVQHQKSEFMKAEGAGLHGPLQRIGVVGVELAVADANQVFRRVVHLARWPLRPAPSLEALGQVRDVPDLLLLRWRLQVERIFLDDVIIEVLVVVRLVRHELQSLVFFFV